MIDFNLRECEILKGNLINIFNKVPLNSIYFNPEIAKTATAYKCELTQDIKTGNIFYVGTRNYSKETIVIRPSNIHIPRKQYKGLCGLEHLYAIDKYATAETTVIFFYNAQDAKNFMERNKFDIIPISDIVRQNESYRTYQNPLSYQDSLSQKRYINLGLEHNVFICKSS